eukprot:scaffold21806_cov49-Attheya_sp.AAC.3
MDVRLLPRPSSNKDVVNVPIKVDFPASTFPTTAMRMLRADKVVATELSSADAAVAFNEAEASLSWTVVTSLSDMEEEED